MKKHARNVQMILDYLTEPRSLIELMEHVGLTDPDTFRTNYTRPLIAEGKIEKVGGGAKTKYRKRND